MITLCVKRFLMWHVDFVVPFKKKKKKLKLLDDVTAVITLLQSD